MVLFEVLIRHCQVTVSHTDFHHGTMSAIFREDQLPLEMVCSVRDITALNTCSWFRLSSQLKRILNKHLFSA